MDNRCLHQLNTSGVDKAAEQMESKDDSNLIRETDLG